MKVLSSKRFLRGLAATMLAGGLLSGATPLSAQTPPEAGRITFQIATGPVSGSYLDAGEAIAFVISHPPGLARCDAPRACGPEGLIATTRSSSGSIANARSVNRGSVQSAIIQSDIAAAASDGTGPFAGSGPLKNLRAIARLHDETLHFVVSTRSRVRQLKDLIGKRVAIDNGNSATESTVRAVLAAARIKPERIKIQLLPADRAADDMRNGKLEAFFVIGSAPVRDVDALVRRGTARIAGLDPRTLRRLSAQSAKYGKATLAAGTYRGSRAVTTLSLASIWVVNRSQPDDVIYKILRALWNPANQAELTRRGKFDASLNPKRAAENLPLPLHKGALRFYAEAGR
jgi:TRAP transporter TAXI family solute receptor